MPAAAPDLDLSLPWHRLPYDVAREIFKMARMVPTPSCEAFRRAYVLFRNPDDWDDWEERKGYGFQVKLRRHFFHMGERVDYRIDVWWNIPLPGWWGDGSEAILRYRRGTMFYTEEWDVWRVLFFDEGEVPERTDMINGDYRRWLKIRHIRALRERAGVAER